MISRLLGELGWGLVCGLEGVGRYLNSQKRWQTKSRADARIGQLGEFLKPERGLVYG